MAQLRIDMSDWVIHFVHRRDPENDPVQYDESGDGEVIPFHAEPDKDARFDLWRIKDEERPLEPDADAFSVLLRIIDDGHIRAGWSMRNGRPTIYGPRPACCFTEMPLFALLHYANVRGNANAVDVYGIAVPKAEFFQAGGRPAIYGLSGKHVEIESSSVWPRILRAECGVAEVEQYRYVAMNLVGNRPIDWSHEREWRWADVQDRCECPGLPLWTHDEHIRFSKAIIIVRTASECERVLDELGQRIDSRLHNYGYLYARETLKNTRVLVLDDALSRPGRVAATLRIDDLPLCELPESVAEVPDRATIDRVRVALAAAKDAADRAAAMNPRSGDVFGFAYVMIGDPRSAIAQALLQLNEATAVGGIGYKLANIGGSYHTGSLGQAESAVDAAITVLERELPGVMFYKRTVWD